jgi:hypothetical protein
VSPLGTLPWKFIIRNDRVGPDLGDDAEAVGEGVKRARNIHSVKIVDARERLREGWDLVVERLAAQNLTVQSLYLLHVSPCLCLYEAGGAAGFRGDVQWL